MMSWDEVNGYVPPAWTSHPDDCRCEVCLGWVEFYRANSYPGAMPDNVSRWETPDGRYHIVTSGPEGLHIVTYDRDGTRIQESWANLVTDVPFLGPFVATTTEEMTK
jgi:hypothetical protein